MLEIVRFNEDAYDFPCLLVLGCFDGLHLGHFELLKKAKLQAKINGLDLGVMMFTNGKENKEGKQLYTFEERLKFLESFNVKFVLKIDYDEEFKKIKPLEFLSLLEDKLNVKAYMSGKDFRFGQGAKGKSSTLKSYAEDEDNGVWFMPVKDLIIEEEKVSTSHIKVLLDEGNVKKAAELLGRNFAVCGTVIHGADRGAKVVGYPTMNVTYPENKHEVKQGVYTVKCGVGEKCYYGIANYGSRPTFDEEAPILEVYLDGLEGEQYDEIITVEFLDRIRDIQKFDSAEELTSQLDKDLLLAKEAAVLAASAAEAAPAPATPAAHTADSAPVAPVAPVEEPAPVEAEPAPAAEEQSAPVEEQPVEDTVTPAEEEEQPAPVEEEVAPTEELEEEPADSVTVSDEAPVEESVPEEEEAPVPTVEELAPATAEPAYEEEEAPAPVDEEPAEETEEKEIPENLDEVVSD
jgi:riboflavin kinase/FMN adenylyltransferase